MNGETAPPSHGKISLEKQLLKGSVIHNNTGQEFLITTGDKVRLALIEFREAVLAGRNWGTPLGIFLSLVTALTTAEFKKDLIGIPANVWQASFLIGAVASFCWLIFGICRAINYREKSSVESVVQKLKKSSPVQD